MLRSLRGSLNSVLVLGLMGLLIASFALWGIPDLFTGASGRTVATVGDQEISDVAFTRSYDQRLRQISAQIGEPLDRQQARQFGLPQQVLQQMIAQTAYDAQAREMGLRASYEQTTSSIREIEAFQNLTGEFSRESYRSALQQAGWTIPEFEATVQQDLVRTQLVGALNAAQPVSPSMAEALFRYRREARVATVLTIPGSTVSAVEPPTEDEIRAAYDANSGRYMTPQYREVAVATITPAALAQPDEISDADIEEEYQARITEFQTPELRNIDFVTFDRDAKSKAEEFRVRVQGGESFADVVADMTEFSADELSLGDMTRADIEADYNERAAEAAFSVQPGDFTEPVQSVFGWHVFRVRDITPPIERPLEQVADALRQDIAERRAEETVYEISIDAENDLARGASLREIADNHGLAYASARISANGETPDGAPADATILDYLSQLTNLAVEAEPTLEQTGDGGFALLDVLGVIPPEQKPYEEVREEVRARLIDQRRLEAAGKIAEQAAERLRGGADPDAIASDIGGSVTTTEPVLREEVGGRGAPVTANIGRLMFDLERGGVDVERNATGDGYVAVRLDSIAPGNPVDDPAGYAQLESRLSQSLRDAALAQYEQALRNSLGVEVNTARFNEVVETQF